MVEKVILFCTGRLVQSESTFVLMVPNVEVQWLTYLTAVFFETGAMPVQTKSRNPTVCGWGGPFHSYLT